MGCNYGINKEKGDGEDGKRVVESDGWSDEEGECGASEETEEEEFSSDEQGHDTDISSGSKEGYEVENDVSIRANVIHFDTDTDDDQPDTRYLDFPSTEIFLSSIPSAMEKPTFNSPLIASERSLWNAASCTSTAMRKTISIRVSPSRALLN